MSYNKVFDATTVRLGPVRFSYANVFEPREDTNGNSSYSVCVMIPKTDKETIKVFEDAVNAAKETGKTTKWNGKVPAGLKEPLRDGDDKDDENFEGFMFFNCRTKNPPDVMVLEGGKRQEAFDSSDFYSGCWGAITVNCYAYNTNGNRGIGVGLKNVIKTKDDERLGGGRTSGESDFSDLD